MTIRQLTAAVLSFVLLAACLGFRECNGGKDANSNSRPKTEAELKAEAEGVVNNVATVIHVTATSIEIGTGTARAYREQGKLDPKTSLKLARAALTANGVMREIADFMLKHDTLNEEGRRQLADLIRGAFSAFRQLQAGGLIKIDNAEVNLYLGVSLVAGEAGLTMAAARLQGKFPQGLHIPVSPVARAELEAAIVVMERNGKTLQESVDLLS